MTMQEKIIIKRQNLMYLQKLFYKMMEKNPEVFKVSTLLYLWKRKSKDPSFDHEKLIKNIVYYPNREYDENVKISRLQIDKELFRLRNMKYETLSTKSKKLKMSLKKKDTKFGNLIQLMDSTEGLNLQQMKNSKMGGIFELVMRQKAINRENQKKDKN